MDNDKELQEYAPGTGILETREQFEARKKAVMSNPLSTMSDFASVGMDDSADFEEVDRALAKRRAEKEAQRNKTIAEAEHKPDQE